MARCGYKIRRLVKKWDCPLDALPEEECCYWHREEDGKKPIEEQLKELKVKEIVGVYLQKAELYRANFREANLSEANLQEAELDGANLQEAELERANLQEASLYGTNLQGAELYLANLQEADLEGANLQGANLHGARFDSKTVLASSVLIGANLSYSYFDEAKSFRNAKVFQNDGAKEINEVVGNALNGWFIKVLKW
jgi:hypothetical protein